MKKNKCGRWKITKDLKIMNPEICYRGQGKRGFVDHFGAKTITIYQWAIKDKNKCRQFKTFKNDVLMTQKYVIEGRLDQGEFTFHQAFGSGFRLQLLGLTALISTVRGFLAS